MKSMLFVDDRTKRIHYALEHYGKEFNVTIATCVPEALRLLSSNVWDVVSLDHDLNGHDFQDPETPTCGMEIIRYIRKCGGWPEMRPHPNVIAGVGGMLSNPKPEIWIHTSNLFAGHLMIQAVHEIGLRGYWKPIRYQTEYIKYDGVGNPK